MARVEQAGQELECCVAYLLDIAVGDYVLIQHHFAVEKLDAHSAAASLAAFQELGLLDSINDVSQRESAAADARGANLSGN
jgi:hydrogenase expression/formation protein HypC